MTNKITDTELKELVEIYKKLPQNKRELWCMGGQLLVASQEMEEKSSKKAG